MACFTVTAAEAVVVTMACLVTGAWACICAAADAVMKRAPRPAADKA